MCTWLTNKAKKSWGTNAGSDLINISFYGEYKKNISFYPNTQLLVQKYVQSFVYKLFSPDDFSPWPSVPLYSRYSAEGQQSTPMAPAGQISCPEKRPGRYRCDKVSLSRDKVPEILFIGIQRRKLFPWLTVWFDQNSEVFFPLNMNNE